MTLHPTWINQTEAAAVISVTVWYPITVLCLSFERFSFSQLYFFPIFGAVQCEKCSFNITNIIRKLKFQPDIHSQKRKLSWFWPLTYNIL